jgi:UDP-glucose 4-epimerase
MGVELRVLITGGAGFIGSNLSRMLVERDESAQVVVLDDFSTGRLGNLADLEVELIEGTILDAPLVTKAMGGVDAVVHLAARASVPRSIANPRATHDTNVTGTLNVLEAAREAGAHVIAASSSSVYGSNPQLPKVESMAIRPMSPYAATKLATEAYTLAWGQSFGLDVLAFRFFNVYGPGQAAGHAYAAVVPTFLDTVLKGCPIPIHGSGEQTRDFTFVETVCAVIQDALARRVSSDCPVNLALGTRTSILDLVELIGDVTGLSVQVDHLPARVGDVPHSSADPGQLLTLFPAVRSYPLEEGLARTYEWMSQQRDDD